MRTFRELLVEIRRRHVFRVAAVYAVVAWLVIEVSSVVSPELMLPEWFTRAIILLALLGFPVALVLTWAYDITPDGITATPPRGAEDAPEPVAEPRDTAAGGPSARATGGGPRRRAAAVVLLLVPLLGLGGLLVLRASGEEALDGPALVERIDELAVAARYDEAFELAATARDAGATIPESIWAEISDRLTVVTDPAGARVLARGFQPSANNAWAEWRPLGVTPLHEVRVPRGDHLLWIERDDYAPIERLASSAVHRAAGYGQVGQPVPGIAYRLRLLPAADLPDDMVYVPGGRYTAASPSLQNPSARLDDFFIDRFEVSNAAYARFVESGGYVDRRHWGDMAASAGATSPDGPIPGLTDRTGLPGPRGWAGQAPPAGQERHPVTGVTWHEASAYCRSIGRRLPTFFEWEKAARDGEIMYIGGVYMPWGPVGPGADVEARANFGGTGTAPVDAHPAGISPYGAYAMAGNVKEWLANQAGRGRAVTGGSWEDPLYLFAQVGAVDPTTSSAALGFRCARHARPHPDGAEQGAGPVTLATEPPVYEPVDDAAFAAMLSHYRYEPSPAEAVVEERIDGGGWTRERIRFTGPSGNRVTAYLYLPKTARPPFQTLVYIPGTDVYWGVSIPVNAEWIMGPVIRSGRALLAVVLHGMTDRERAEDDREPEPPTVRFRDELVRDAIEIRAAIDYLATRTEIDLDALAYAAVSRGSGSRLAFGAVDPRFKAAILIGAGIDERMRPTLAEVDNVNFAPRMPTPILFLNGRQDEEHPWLTRGLPLWNLLPEPKELVLIEGAGHLPPAELRIPPILEFLDRTFGPVAR